MITENRQNVNTDNVVEQKYFQEYFQEYFLSPVHIYYKEKVTR